MAILKATEQSSEPAGTYHARVISITEKPFQRPDGLQDLLSWEFEARRDEGTTFIVSDLSSQKFTSGPYEAKARKWAEALLGRRIEADEIRDGFDTDVLLGKPCRIVLDTKTSDRGTFNKISDLLPANAD